MHDCFGRERSGAEDGNDRDGVGCFLKENRTLWAGGVPVLDEALARERVRRNFGEWGRISSVRLVKNKSCAFIQYAFRANAELAKEAMANQALLTVEELESRGTDSSDRERAKTSGPRRPPSSSGAGGGVPAERDGPILHVRWAAEDPNPRAVKHAREGHAQTLLAAQVASGSLPRDVTGRLPGADRALLRKMGMDPNNPVQVDVEFQNTQRQYLAIQGDIGAHSHNPSAQRNFPNTDDQYPNTDHQYPNTDHQYPNTDHQYPNTDHQYPNTDRQYPSAEHQYPGADPLCPNHDHQYRSAGCQYPHDDHQYQRGDYEYPNNHHQYIGMLDQGHHGSVKGAAATIRPGGKQRLGDTCSNDGRGNTEGTVQSSGKMPSSRSRASAPSSFLCGNSSPANAPGQGAGRTRANVVEQTANTGDEPPKGGPAVVDTASMSGTATVETDAKAPAGGSLSLLGGYDSDDSE